MYFSFFPFQPDSQTVVGIRFLANPVPEANEVIWHHSPPVSEEGAPPPPGEFNLESGMVSQTLFKKYLLHSYVLRWSGFLSIRL